MLKLYVRVKSWMAGQRGQAAPEYGMIVALVLLGVIVAITAFRSELIKVFNDTTEGLRKR